MLESTCALHSALQTTVDIPHPLLISNVSAADSSFQISAAYVVFVALRVANIRLNAARIGVADTFGGRNLTV